jgi:hypothetical protein
LVDPSSHTIAPATMENIPATKLLCPLDCSVPKYAFLELRLLVHGNSHLVLRSKTRFPLFIRIGQSTLTDRFTTCRGQLSMFLPLSRCRISNYHWNDLMLSFRFTCLGRWRGDKRFRSRKALNSASLSNYRVAGVGPSRVTLVTFLQNGKA